MDTTPMETFVRKNLDTLKPRDYGEVSAVGHPNLFAQAARRAKIRVVSPSQHQRVFLYNGKTIGGAEGFLTSLTSVEGLRASQDRGLLRSYLTAANVPLPQGHVFHGDARQDAEAYAYQTARAVAVKPQFGKSGLGVSLRVNSPDQFAEAWLLAEHRTAAPGDTQGGVVVEEFHDGIDLRVYVVGEEVVAAVVRLPLFALGDGRSTVGELSEAADLLRRKNPLLANYSSDIEKTLFLSGTSPGEISEEGRLYWLSPGTNIKLGGLTVDVTDKIHPTLKDLAIDARWAIPGSPIAGVDLRVQDLESAEGARVVEVDARASLSVHHFPWAGATRRVSDAVLGYMRGA